ncbi:hypothetical protein EVAR_51839_1 [Eumeta japonica]|uniref:Uncharacterized protein n=1 Tax=Eumeta variegata TaxID=151549 RepID=A0A4C1YU23_EUMVA|nr:hypothetical protein EVAR_51839_1 [Eumeta japonica]
MSQPLRACATRPRRLFREARLRGRETRLLSTNECVEKRLVDPIYRTMHVIVNGQVYFWRFLAAQFGADAVYYIFKVESSHATLRFSSYHPERMLINVFMKRQSRSGAAGGAGGAALITLGGAGGAVDRQIFRSAHLR